MKTISKIKPAAPRRRAVIRARAVSSKVTAEAFRSQLNRDLAADIAAAQASFAKTHPDILRSHTPAEIKAGIAKWRAMETKARKTPVNKEESESYDRMLARMSAERAG
jgi:hypothetical protein